MSDSITTLSTGNSGLDQEQAPPKNTSGDGIESAPSHDRKMELARLFIGMASPEVDTHLNRMDPEEVEDLIQLLRERDSITEKDEETLRLELDKALGRTPEQIREGKLALIDTFINMASPTRDPNLGHMDSEEVLENIDRMLELGFINKEDAKESKQRLLEALGQTPEQLRELKLGLGNEFIKLVNERKMDRDEAKELIDHMVQIGHILDSDEEALLEKIIY